MKKLLALVAFLSILLSLLPLGLSSARGTTFSSPLPPPPEVVTDIWLELTCEGGTAGIHNLSDVAGVEIVTALLDGQIVGSHPVPLEAGQTIEMSVNWAEMGLTPPLTEAHTITIMTDDDQATTSVGPCIEPPPPPEPGMVTAHKFYDANENGVQDDGEGDIEGWLFRLYFLDGDSIHLVAEGSTGPDGTVTFTNVPPGLYKVWEALPECWTPTTPPGRHWNGGYYTTVDLGEGQHVAFEFGNVEGCAPPPKPPPPEPETCIDLEKTGPETAGPGETITYHFWVHNCGEVILAGGAQVYDPLFGDEPIWSGDLEPGQVHEFDMPYILPDDYCGEFTNDAWAIGHPPGYPKVRDDDSWTVVVICEPEPNPSIDIEKSTNGEDADVPTGPDIPVGDPVTWEYVVTNTGNVDLTNVVVTDDQLGLICTVSFLAAGDSVTCTVEGAAAEGQYENLATVEGSYGDVLVSDEDPSHYFGTEDEWDRSSLYFDAGCEGDCEQISATVCNGDDSEDMAGPTTWELYWIASGNPRDGVVIASGTINPLSAGECQTLTYNPGDNPNGASGNYMFKAYQRPGHPGQGVLWSEACELECEACDDADGDGVCDNEDNCVDTPNPGQEDGDGDGVGDACDGCPDDPGKTDPGACGCGIPDTDSDGDGTPDCNDGCPTDPAKTEPGICGCGTPDTDSDGDGVLDCEDGCPDDPNKTDPGICGCGTPDTDSDGDGVADCNDNCPDIYNPGQEDSDGDGVGDACDGETPWDHSSLLFSSGCEGDCGEITAEVCNGADEDMAGSTTWELYWIASGNARNGEVIASGTIQALAAGECQTLTYNPSDNPNGASGNYVFKAYQRPGHPGQGVLWSEACELECEAEVDSVAATQVAAAVDQVCLVMGRLAQLRFMFP